MRRRGLIAVTLALLLAGPAWAADYRSVGAEPAVLYDAPSVNARPLYVASPGYPVEFPVARHIGSTGRAAAGARGWIEPRARAAPATVLVSVPLAQVREAPKAGARVAFEAQQGVVLERLESTVPGWIRVRHRDGAEGFVAVSQVWGA